MEQVSLEAKGINGKLELLEDKVRIVRKGTWSLLTQGLKGNKEILISQISSIQFKAAGHLTNGYMQVAFLGGQESKRGIFDAVKDENTVMFNKKQQPSFEAIKMELDKKMATPKTEAKVSSELDELEKLASLRDRNIITEEEFQIKKKNLLGI